MYNDKINLKMMCHKRILSLSLSLSLSYLIHFHFVFLKKFNVESPNLIALHMLENVLQVNHCESISVHFKLYRLGIIPFIFVEEFK